MNALILSRKGMADMKDYESTEIAYKNGYAKGLKDAVKSVVRCKDCAKFIKYTEENRKTVEKADGYCWIRCMYAPKQPQFWAVENDDYCSLGRRRNDDA